MTDNPLVEIKAVWFTRCLIFDNRIELKHLISEQVILRNKVNSVRKNWVGNITISTAGGEDYKIVTWNKEDGEKVYNLLKNWG